MINFKAIALTALAATTLGFAAPNAKASGCYDSTATNILELSISGGASLNEAWAWAVQDGAATNDRRCWTRVSGYVRQYRMIKPYAYNAIFN